MAGCNVLLKLQREGNYQHGRTAGHIFYAFMCLQLYMEENICAHVTVCPKEGDDGAVR